MATIISNNSKTILELSPGNQTSQVPEMAFPVQLGNANYHLLVQDILNLITKEYLQLDQVNNTSDINKPISVPTSRALLLKAEKVHTHAFSDIPGLVDELALFFSKNEQIPLSNLQSVLNALADYADKLHQHSIQDIQGLELALANKADLAHNHVLSELQGYDTFVLNLNRILDEKLNLQQVETLVDNKLNDFEQRIEEIVGTDTIKEIPGEW